jgi:hypothetical protein
MFASTFQEDCHTHAMHRAASSAAAGRTLQRSWCKITESFTVGYSAGGDFRGLGDRQEAESGPIYSTANLGVAAGRAGPCTSAGTVL